MTDIKKNIESILKFLKEHGHSRAMIEEALGYSEKSINQNLSKGGSLKLLKGIELYKEAKLQNAIPVSDSSKTPQIDVMPLTTLEYLTERVKYLEAQNERLKRGLAGNSKHVEGNTGSKGQAESA